MSVGGERPLLAFLVQATKVSPRPMPVLPRPGDAAQEVDEHQRDWFADAEQQDERGEDGR